MLAISRHERSDPGTRSVSVEYTLSHESVRFALYARGLPKKSRMPAIELITATHRGCELGLDWPTVRALARRRIDGGHEEPGDRELLSLDEVGDDGE